MTMRLLPFLLASMIATSALAAVSSRAPSTNNDDSCDLAVAPAATLLLPYFEVDFKQPRTNAANTLFTIVNVSPLPQIVNVTLWTDWAEPAVWFPLFLTGYDVRSVDLYDLFTRGVLGGAHTAAISGNPNFLAASCANLPGNLSPAQLTDMQLLFTAGRLAYAAFGCEPANRVGETHSNAIGYATVDVVAGCSTADPWSKEHFGETLLFDNVLIGDYEQIVPGPETTYARGGPLVHLRAIPEGGPAGSVAATNLPYTFYDRYTSGAARRTLDRRQPLPSAFVVRWAENSTKGLRTTFKLWREGLTAGGGACSDVRLNSNMTTSEIVRFDEHENGTVNGGCSVPCPPPPGIAAVLEFPMSSFRIPPFSTSGDTAGWLFLNLNNEGSAAYSTAGGRDFRNGTSTRTGPRQSQNWVIATIFTDPKYATDFPATPLGNGCSPAPPLTFSSGRPLGPSPNTNP